MTIGKQIAEWLKAYSHGVEVKEILQSDKMTEAIPEAYGTTEMTDEIVQFVDGSRDVTRRCYLRVQQPVGEEQLAHEEWLERLKEWIDSQGMMKNLPALSARQYCQNIKILGSYLHEQTEDGPIYQIGVRINYFQEV